MVLVQELPIVKNNHMKGPYYYLEIFSPTMASRAVAGQFLHLRISTSYDPILRRPLSLYRIQKKTGELGILYQVKGRGTTILSKKKAGETLDVMGPCGRGFQLVKEGPVLVVAGGIGVAPLWSLVESLGQENIGVDFLIGAFDKESLLYQEITSPQVSQYLCTEDGSMGFDGLVTELARRFLEEKRYTQVYSCGPVAMLKSMARLSSNQDIPCQISIEGRMGCGMGFCLACGVKKNNTEGYYRLCTEGPVFDAKEVSLEED